MATQGEVQTYRAGVCFLASLMCVEMTALVMVCGYSCLRSRPCKASAPGVIVFAFVVALISGGCAVNEGRKWIRNAPAGEDERAEVARYNAKGRAPQAPVAAAGRDVEIPMVK